MKLKLPPWSQNWGSFLKKYQYVLLVALVGAVLLLLPTGERPAPDTPAPASEQIFRLDDLEERLEQALSRIEGAGTVHAVLTLKSGSRQILAQTIERESGGGSTYAPVTVGRGTGSQEVVPLQTLAPEFQGALIVCQGGGDPAVRLNVLQAVSALTGLGADKISICQGG